MNIFSFKKIRDALACFFVVTIIAATGSLIPTNAAYALGGLTGAKCGVPPVQPCASEATAKLGLVQNSITAANTTQIILKQTPLY